MGANHERRRRCRVFTAAQGQHVGEELVQEIGLHCRSHMRVEEVLDLHRTETVDWLLRRASGQPPALLWLAAVREGEGVQGWIIEGGKESAEISWDVLRIKGTQDV
jgi:hypothetical protein